MSSTSEFTEAYFLSFTVFLKVNVPCVYIKNNYIYIYNFRIKKTKEIFTVVPLKEKSKGELAHLFLLPYVLLGC